MPFLEELKITNLLSFGEDSHPISLSSLNVLVGANGVGKSNLLEAISLLQAAPKELNKPMRDAGGIGEWLWKGGTAKPSASVEAIINIKSLHPLRHVLSIQESAHRLEIVEERIENLEPLPGEKEPFFYYKFKNGQAHLNYCNYAGAKMRELRREDLHPEQSILAQRKDIDSFPEITRLGEAYTMIKLYREWSIGRFTIPRQFQNTAGRTDYLEEDFSNLAMVLNHIRTNLASKALLLEYLKYLNSDIVDFDGQVEGGKVQIFFHEQGAQSSKGMKIPATRLSDGTLRYIALLAILCHPNPPPLVCIEEPEMGLHPDIIPKIGELLKLAAERMQIIVTTHSDFLVDCFTDDPERVIVCDKNNMQTIMKRLKKSELKDWLDDYRSVDNVQSLGQKWLNGEIGGVRW
ncbi:AAA family ATPase [Candidatus Magnetaquicoccus inordinatus]|uniref:AAA family ATPase n=1 Tax=Candidatus Magnetaquicoccus inordinatus TaxID=2496818 RepID=UPI00102C9580|nr:AAA family ATPase [Candidatus Magnetaquicoccus inordinatus]